ncbi:glucokinase [Weizmannia acidilactici]|uniref:Glucokinase n=1 Tax=Weizmannia acidilactici TaxID=2607726 RepID=A0A5J4JLN0_9BACI|nr:ROK family glucokinase [Weizmannia acidilactici]GER71468.1 glucokinase [Weizmannia acidilactici]GER72770.1 glucokinase [Weizmannia acidilactici]
MAEKWVTGVDLGGTTTKLAFLNEKGDIFHRWEIPTDTSEKGKAILPNIAKSIDGQLAALHWDKKDIAGIGIGVPGPVDMEAGVIYESVNIGWVQNYPVVDTLQQLTGLKVVIDNDANVAALGEMWKGAGEGSDDMVFVTLGTGVGGGIITGGDIVHGVKGAAGEIGHITVIPDGGAPCNCGKTGCLETVASATGVVRTAKKKIAAYSSPSTLKDLYSQAGSVTSKDVFDLAAAGDALANEVVDETAKYLGLALANVANTFNPEKIILGGGVSKAGDTLLNPLRTYFSKYAFTTVGKSTKLKLATLGNDAGVIGAAWLVLNKN